MCPPDRAAQYPNWRWPARNPQPAATVADLATPDCEWEGGAYRALDEGVHVIPVIPWSRSSTATMAKFC